MKRGRVGVEVEIGGLAVDETAAASAEVLGSRPCVEATFVRSLPSPWGDFRLEVLDTAGERLAGFGDRLRLESVIAFSRIGFPPPRARRLLHDALAHHVLHEAGITCVVTGRTNPSKVDTHHGCVRLFRTSAVARPAVVGAGIQVDAFLVADHQGIFAPPSACTPSIAATRTLVFRVRAARRPRYYHSHQ